MITRWNPNNKFNAKKTSYKGKKYDSRKEAAYAEILDGLLKDKKILKWERQVRYNLPDINWLEKGTNRSWYSADFVVTTLDHRRHVVEVKGLLTSENKLKYAFFKYYHKLPLHVVYTTGEAKMNTDWLGCKDCPEGGKTYFDIEAEKAAWGVY